jgi:hypothetical protein
MAKEQKKKVPKGLPKRVRNTGAKARRARCLDRQAAKKLRHLLRRNGAERAKAWAKQHNELALLQRMQEGKAA